MGSSNTILMSCRVCFIHSTCVQHSAAAIYSTSVLDKYIENCFLLIQATSDSPKKNVLVVEPDYLPDSEVFYFQPCLYPMKYLHPISMYTLPRGGVQRGGTPSVGSRGAIPLVGGSGGKRGFMGKAPEEKIAL